MWNLSLTACSFHLRKKHAKGIERIYPLNDKFKLSNKDKTEKIMGNALEAFKNFFKLHDAYKDDPDEKRMLSCSYIDTDCGEKDNYNYILGIIHSGTYGVPSVITDRITNQIVHKRTNSQADIKDFYLMIIIPKDNDKVTVQKGLMFFQNIGQFGVKTATTKYLKEYFAEHLEISFHSGNISPDIFVSKLFFNNKINKLLLTKNYLSDDIADRVNKGYGQEVRMLSQLNLSTRLIDKMRDFAKGRNRVFEFEQINYDKLRINVDVGGRERTINLHNIENLSVIEAIPNEILMIDGTVKKSELLEHYFKVADEYMETMVFQIVK